MKFILIETKLKIIKNYKTFHLNLNVSFSNYPSNPNFQTLVKLQQQLIVLNKYLNPGASIQYLTIDDGADWIFAQMLFGYDYLIMKCKYQAGQIFK